MKKRKWAHVATYETTPLADGRTMWRLIQADLFDAGAIVHRTIRHRNINWAVGEMRLRSELATSPKSVSFFVRQEIDFRK
jgi:hypothetical protein